jgi:serine/threonine-protein kinase
MATVYLARDLRHGRPVALKVLRPELAASLGPERFAREIHVAAGLQHPHILSVHDSGEAGGRVWFTMPFVEGESLRDRLRREGQLPLEDALRIAREAAQGLHHAHQHGVVHRDIKPENLLLTADGATLVADFGISHALAGDDERLTSTGLVLGTPVYMSPEQAAGGRAMDGRADVYSLGCVLYEMLAGEPPFTGPTAQAIIAKRLGGPPPKVSLVRPGLPAEVVAAVDRALAVLPADRFRNMAEFGRALEPSATAAPAAETVASGSHRPAPARWRLLLVLGAGAVAAAAAWLLVRHSRAAPTLDPDVVAVAPFDVPDPRLGLWREGLVDVLSRNLDGAGPVRSVPPTVVVRRWSGRADRPSAAALGRRTGAGLVVFGSLLGAGPDSGRVTATVFDVASDRPLAELELRDAADRMDRVADSLTVRLLRELGRTRRIEALRTTSLGSSSLPALKAFLQGEQWFRRAAWDSARVSYERAMAIDSLFPLPLWRLSQVLGWTRSALDTTSVALALRAGQLNRGLGTRDSLLVATDSVLSALYATIPRVSWATLQRAHALARELTRRYPDDAESWYLLGEARYHWGTAVGISAAAALEAFDRSIRCDSSFLPSYLHPVELGFRLDGLEGGRRYARHYLARSPTDESASGIRLADTVAGMVLAGLDPGPVLRGATPSDLREAHSVLRTAGDSAETAVAVARALVAAPDVDDPILGRQQREERLGQTLLNRGHIREAARYLYGNPETIPAYLFELALLSRVLPDSVDREFRRLLRGNRLLAVSTSLSWWLARGDSAALREMVRHGDSLSRTAPRETDRRIAAHSSRAAAAHLTLMRGDSSAAVRMLEALPDSLCPLCFPARMTLGHLLAARHDDRKAAAQLDRPLVDLELPSNVLWVLERGRVAERLGDREKATRSYQYVADMWRHADRELQAYVAEAREGLGRMTSEPR